MSTILAQQSLLPYWRHRAWGAIYLGVGVCTVYVHVPLVRSVNMVTEFITHVERHTGEGTSRNFFFLERSLLVWRISRTATLRLYKKKSGVTLWRSPGLIMYIPILVHVHVNLINLGPAPSHAGV
jgi:hypothetical protein